jgi:site-specific DNA recombinase
MTKAAIYARISESDTKTPAVKNQIANLEALAKSEGYTVVRTYSDDGISAYSGKARPGYLDLVRGIRAKDFEVILAVAEDRLTRSSEEKIGLQSESVRAGVTWHTLASGKVDPSTAEGGLLATVTGALAQYESTLKAERLQRSVADRLAKGIDLGGPRPFGFEADRLTVRQAEADVLAEGYKMILEGATVWKVTQMFTDSGIQRDRAKDSAWRTQTVRHILLRERNAGRLVVKGELYSEALPQLIDPETFDQAKAILENPARAPRRGPKPTTWAAIGSVRCGTCGGYLSQTATRKADGKRHLRCSPNGRPSGFEGQRHAAMEAVSMDVQLRTIVLAKLVGRGLSGKGYKGDSAPVTPIRVKLAELARQRDLAQDLMFTPGANVPAAKKKLATLADAIDTAQAELDAALSADTASAALDAAMAVIANFPGGTSDREPVEWIEYWAAIDVESQRALVLALAPGALLMPKGQEHLGFRIKTDWSDVEQFQHTA